jgi:hypothetical protein
LKTETGEIISKKEALVREAMECGFQRFEAEAFYNCLRRFQQQEPVAWEGGEGWESLAWELCADENGEDSCNELIWEGGPIPEPWGDRWMKYEEEAKRLIALVQKHTTPPQRKPLTDEEIEATFTKCGGKWNGGQWVIEDADLHPFVRTIEHPELNTLRAISDEYNAWIRHDAAGHDYDDFLAKRLAATWR